MYAIAIVRYRRPIEEVVAVQDPHRAYLRQLKAEGTLVASGPMDPRYGGMFLLKVSDDNPQRDLDAIRDGDPVLQSPRGSVPADWVEREHRQGRPRPHLDARSSSLKWRGRVAYLKYDFARVACTPLVASSAHTLHPTLTPIS